MKAMLLTEIQKIEPHGEPLQFVDVPKPQPTEHELLIKVSACGVCHTELDEIEGRTPPRFLPIVPGHQIIGTVAEIGSRVTLHSRGDRIGIGWIHQSDGTATENLSPAFRATGRDVNGGYAEFTTVHENYAFPIPDVFSDEQAAPLLCAGAIGYRALNLTQLTNGQPLGLTGFGGSAHIVIQLARYLFPATPVHVFARDKKERQFARELGAVWAGDTKDCPPEPLQAIIDTTPAWTPVVSALGNLKPGGRVVVNAIRKQDTDKHALLDLQYESHLWMERELKTVANITGHDIREFLQVAGDIPIETTVECYPLQEANRALSELKLGSIRGAKVLRTGH